MSRDGWIFAITAVLGYVHVNQHKFQGGDIFIVSVVFVRLVKFSWILENYKFLRLQQNVQLSCRNDVLNCFPIICITLRLRHFAGKFCSSSEWKSTRRQRAVSAGKFSKIDTKQNDSLTGLERLSD